MSNYPVKKDGETIYTYVQRLFEYVHDDSVKKSRHDYTSVLENTKQILFKMYPKSDRVALRTQFKKSGSNIGSLKSDISTVEKQYTDSESDFRKRLVQIQTDQKLPTWEAVFDKIGHINVNKIPWNPAQPADPKPDDTVEIVDQTGVADEFDTIPANDTPDVAKVLAFIDAVDDVTDTYTPKLTPQKPIKKLKKKIKHETVVQLEKKYKSIKSKIAYRTKAVSDSTSVDTKRTQLKNVKTEIQQMRDGVLSEKCRGRCF
jgi:hypothetical protein